MEGVKDGIDDGLNLENQNNVPKNLQLAEPGVQPAKDYESHCLELPWAG